MEPDNNRVLFGHRHEFGGKQPFGLDISERRQHLYVIGQTGTGKSTFEMWRINALSAEDCALSFQDCQFYGGYMPVEAPSWWVTNCLFQRVNVYDSDRLDDEATTNFFCNNLLVDGEFTFNHMDVGIWTVRDNLFDGTLITNLNDPIDICSNNAYVTTNYGVVLPSNNIVVLTNSPDYETGTLGSYYYPTNQTNLIHQGSRLASAAGLYHYTVTTNNVIEGTNSCYHQTVGASTMAGLVETLTAHFWRSKDCRISGQCQRH